MHAWISYNPSRREVWRGHETKDGVRRAIAFADRHNDDLHIFVLDAIDAYCEIPRAYWDREFAK